MSQPFQPQPQIHIVQAPSNGLGTAGFVLSLIGFLTCGLLSPVGLLLSLAALLKPPRGLAIAGFLLGGLGSWWLFAFGFVMMAALLAPATQAARKSTSPTVAAPSAAKTVDAVTERMRIGKGYNQGRNDLEGRTDDTPQEPIIAAAHAALKEFYKGEVTVVGVSNVKIIEAGKAWAVIGEYNAPSDSRFEFQSIVRGDAAGHYEAGNLLLGDDVVMDKILGHAEPEAVATVLMPEPPAAVEPDPDLRTWTSAHGKFAVEAEFLSSSNGKKKLKKADGKVIDLPKDKLSDVDREWLKSRGR